MKLEIKCPYCGKKAKWTSNEVVYGRRCGKSWMCYYCQDCDAYVGCHNNTDKPLGTMANKELREWRVKAHEIFDRYWKDKEMDRKWAYGQLRDLFGKEIHIGSSDIETCKKIINNFNLAHSSKKL
jgi:hypothetical protein